MPTPDHPPGWYPDPLGFAEQRWWDGESWTDDVVAPHDQAPETRDIPPPMATPAATGPAGHAGESSPTMPPAAPAVAGSTGPAPVVAGRGPADDRTRSRRWAALLALLGVISASVGVILYLDDDPVLPPANVAVATLEPAGALGPDPFAGDAPIAAVVDVQPELEAPLDELSVPVVSTATPSDPSAGSSAAVGDAAAQVGPVVRVSATAPGLYGGTEDNTRCDVDQLVEFLAVNPAKSTAWVDALNADPTVRFRDDLLGSDDVGSYVDTLTPAVLMADTLVVNHGFADGRATPREAVLQKGSAVLVDDLGVPRTRCACGNPLTRPPTEITQVEPVGSPWPGYNPNKVAVVEPLPATVTFLRLIDLQTGAEFDRPVGTKGERDLPVVEATPTPEPTAVAEPTPVPTPAPAEPTPAPTPEPTVTLGTGDVQVTLRWSTDTDLDLHVIDPSGSEISFGARTSATGGQLDVDDIPEPGDTGPHVENIFWPDGGAPAGDYEAWVEHYSGPPSSYRLVVRRNGERIHTEEATLAPGEASPRFTFSR